MHLCDLQNLEVRLVKSDAMGRMIPEELEKALDPSRLALVVLAEPQLLLEVYDAGVIL